MIHMNEKRESYLSHLVRLQCVNAVDGPAWRIFVQPIGQKEPLYFSDLKEYFDFVKGETKTAVTTPSNPSTL